MDYSALKQLLAGSFNDSRFDDREQDELRRALDGCTLDDLHFVRNCALEILEQRMSGSPPGLAVRWLRDILKVLAAETERRMPSISLALFGPGDDCRKEILRRCAASSRSIDVCMFTVSNDDMVSAIIDAHRRGVAVRLISDDVKVGDEGSDVREIATCGIPVVTDRDVHTHMHHKFAVFDAKILVNGSLNWTRAGTDENRENIIVTDAPGLVTQFCAEFDRLWGRFGGRA